MLLVLIPTLLLMSVAFGTLSVRGLLHKRSPLWLRGVALLLAILVMVIAILVMVTAGTALIGDLQHL